MNTDTCPRCASTFIHGVTDGPDGNGPGHLRCDECDHRWNDDYFPLSQQVPLPDGMKDCGWCDGMGDVAGGFGQCSRCHGAGIVAV